MNFDSELLREIKSRADIKDIIGSYIPVQKKGRSYVAVCPFHDDHDPSLHINVEKQMFMCFVCHTGGDVFNFVQHYEHISFAEAVVKVAEFVGYDDPRLHQNSQTAKKVDDNIVPLYKCINELQKYYQYGLLTEEGKVAQVYLDSRGITQEQKDKFGLGYSLKDGKITINYLKTKGFSIKEIERIGIALANNANMADNNAGRLIFPICDSSGQVLGFSARKMSNGDDVPKYVNSPETEIFKKGNILYNLHNAKQTCRHDGYIYLVEGFMDVFALDSIGFPSVVALMGTNLTMDQVRVLKRLNVEVRLCLDGDGPGQKAMMRIMPMFDSENVQYRIVSKPGEVRDPDEVLKQDGPVALRDFITTLVDPFAFAVNFYENTYTLTTREEKEKVIKHFVPMLASTKNKLEFDDYLYKLSKVTGFDIRAIKEYVNRVKPDEYQNSISDGEEFVPITSVDTTQYDGLNVRKELKRLTLTERAVLLQMINSGEAIKYFESNIKGFIDEIYHKIALYIMDYQDSHCAETIDISMIMDNISMSEEENKNDLVATLSNLSMANDVPPYNEDTMQQYALIIDDEKNKLAEKRELEDELNGKDEKDKMKAMKEFLEKKRLEADAKKRK